MFFPKIALFAITAGAIVSPFVTGKSVRGSTNDRNLAECDVDAVIPTVSNPIMERVSSIHQTDGFDLVFHHFCISRYHLLRVNLSLSCMTYLNKFLFLSCAHFLAFILAACICSLLQFHIFILTTHPCSTYSLSTAPIQRRRSHCLADGPHRG